MDISDAKYGDAEKTCVVATIDGVRLSVPSDPGNKDFTEIMRQVEEGNLTILEPEA